MDEHGAQLGVAAAGALIVGYPIVTSLRSGAGIPDASRLVKPLIVVGGCALLSQLSPWLGLGLAVLVALQMLLGTPAAQAKPAQRRQPRGPSTHTPHR